MHKPLKNGTECMWREALEVRLGGNSGPGPAGPPMPSEGCGALACGTLLSLPGLLELGHPGPMQTYQCKSPGKADWEHRCQGQGGAMLGELPGKGQAGERQRGTEM